MGTNNNKKIKKFLNVLFYVLLVSYILFTGINTYAGHEEERAEIQKAYEKGQISDDDYDYFMKYYDQADDKEGKLEENHEKLGESIERETEEGGFLSNIGNIFFDAIVKAIEWLADIILRVGLSFIVRLVMEIVELFANELFGIASTTFYPESQNNIIGSVYGTLNSSIMAIALSLIMLMALYKGFMTYIMWKDGNPEENPLEIIFRYMFSIAMLFSFNELFAIAASIIGSLNNGFNISSGSVNLTGGLINIIANFNTGQQILTIVLLIKFLKTLYNAIITVITKGIEIMILRLGFPFACVSAITPQASGFHNYIVSIARGMFSIVVMSVFIGLSTKIISGSFTFSNIFWAIAVLEVANNGGSIINSIISTGGGTQIGNEAVGGIQGAGISAGRMAVKAIKGIATGGAGAAS